MKEFTSIKRGRGKNIKKKIRVDKIVKDINKEKRERQRDKEEERERKEERYRWKE